MRHGRLHWYSPEELGGTQRDIYAGVLAKYGARPPFPLTDPEGRLHGPFNAMLAAPGVGAALQALSAAVGSGTSLPPRTREIVILAVAAERDSAFEWSAHRRVAATVGLTDEEIAALGARATPSSLDAAERAAVEAARALLRDRDLDDARHAAVEAAFGEAGVVELITLTGYYDFLATLLRALRVPVPAEEPGGGPTRHG
ncbi:4-carboxymuconolactone decarboxylase [Marinactinospora thermotolerans DSM 45154]|uniref:4-carboxymuconolactone decarboxylase n=1 Tax=Marinactinospora thermotolerans DSM 45154 TaxID=1122192 RepID=A0A1T4TB19_9ACTN|nr:carboxymuconolactone decarboxylase family protein [Marinactinospora thermotolerans]SKA37674.1 4-carboxymuconolactone decarboxylase [Marinactinospora thermotolerans DSM 45154]